VSGDATRFQLEGLSLLTKQLNALASLEEGQALKRAVKAGIKQALIRAQQIIPVGHAPHRTYKGLLVAPGFARDSLRTISTINPAKNIASGILGVRKQAYYIAQFIELGTRFVPAQPWIRRALAEARSDCEAEFVASIARSVERAAKTT
jgi:HK97 gp10 family phage protein